MPEILAQNDNSIYIQNALFATWDSTPSCWRGISLSLPGAGKRNNIAQLETTSCVAGLHANIAYSETSQVWGGAPFPSVELLQFSSTGLSQPDSSSCYRAHTEFLVKEEYWYWHLMFYLTLTAPIIGTASPSCIHLFHFRLLCCLIISVF